MQLKAEDYLEPSCPLCGKPGQIQPAQPIPVPRVMERLQLYEDRGDWAAAGRHLRYWLAEAEQNGDRRGQLTLQNELMGFCRKQGEREQALAHAEAAVRLVDALDMRETVTAGTTWVNAGTVLEAFGDPAAGLRYFEWARANYERNLSLEDPRLGGLYNNMALALSALHQYRQAEEMFRLALSVMGRQPNGQLEQAVTWLNLADLAEAEAGPEAAEPTVQEYLSRATDLLNAPGLPRDGAYAFVCEKCAPVFGHYGYFLEEAELRRRAAEIRGSTSERMDAS